MGNADSLPAALDEAEAASPNQAAAGIKLYKWHCEGPGNWLVASSNAEIEFYDVNEDKQGQYPCWHLLIEDEDIDEPVDDSLEHSSNEAERRYTFSTEANAYALKFPSVQSFQSFHHKFVDKLFFNKYGVENTEKSRVKIFGADYADMYGENAPAPMDEDDDEKTEEEGIYSPERLQKKQNYKEGTPISGIVLGANENSFLMRGDQFEVLRNVRGGVEDKGFSFSATPNKGAHVTPSKVLLMNREQHMSMINPTTPTSIFRINIEREQVVDTWKFEKDGTEVPIRDIAMNSKSAPLEEHNSFLGIDSNRLCRWDMRASSTPVQASPIVSWTGGKDFSRGTNFKCMATSGEGHVVIGSSDGKIRLYSEKTLTQAKTSFPGLGAPVTSVDVTYDGKWVLATTDTYLMLLQTIFIDKMGKETNGFKSRMGKAAPTPKLLRLRPEDSVKTGRKPFTKAKFTWVTEQGHNERWIVASVGSYSVLFNFRKVKERTAEVGLGGLPTVMNYELHAKDEQVVDSTFMHENYKLDGDMDALLALTSHDIFSAI